MPFLEIIHMTGETDRVKLSKQNPVTIGSHPSTDITIDEDDVEIMHCRISWGKTGFEAVAAGTEPLSHNGNLVKNAKLKAGDTLRFGTVDVRYRDSDNDGKDASVTSSSNEELGLKPLTEEYPTAPSATTPKAPSNVDEISEDDILDDDDFIDDEDIIDDVDLIEDEGSGGNLAAGLAALAQAENQSGPRKSSSKKKKSRTKSQPKSESKGSEPKSSPSGTKQPSATKDSPTTSAAPSAPADQVESSASDSSAPVPSSRKPDDEYSPRLREAMRNRQRRPGEEDPFRSPLVLALVGGAFALILAGGIFYFIASRQTTQQQFDQAKGVYDEGKFQNAIAEFESFILKHPRQDLTEEAKTLLGLAKVRQQIEGASPKFEEGLNELRIFIRDNSDREEAFEALHPEIVTHAKTISLEAAVTAGKRFDPELLRISREARTILNTYAPKDAPPTETLNQIETALRTSEAAILKNDVYKEHLARMEKALAGDSPAKTSPMEALRARRDLLVRYPKTSPTDRNSFETDKEVVKYFKKALEMEKLKVVATDTDTKAIVDDREFDTKPITLAFHGRTKVDEVSVGNSVIVVAKDCCYGVDFVTGVPVWRREIGFDSPFFPLLDSKLPSIILFDTNHRELVRLNQTTGQMIWRLPVDDYISGTPLLVDNTIYAATESGQLLAVDLDTGLLAGVLEFSQPISGPVQLSDDQHLFVAGNEEVCYTISKRPFACVQVSYLGQQPASISAPLLAMGPYVLMIENKTDSATLRLLNASDPAKPVNEVASSVVGSRVIDQPVIRGRDLFVPATGESIYAFSVSDDPGQPPLTTGPVFEGQGSAAESINLLTGPNGQVWMSTDALNRLQLTTDSLQPDGNPTSPGIATQPLQMVSGYLLNARRRPYTDAVTFTRTNRDDMTSDWQVVVGGRILATTARSGDSLNIAAVNEAGQAFRISGRDVESSNFVTDATVRLPLHADLETPLIGAEISGNRLAVAAGLPEPRLWIINAAGQIEGSPRIPEPLQAAPSRLGDRIVLPLPGRLSVAKLSGQSAVQDFVLPTGSDHEWQSVLPVKDDVIVAVTKSGVVFLVKLEKGARPHLAEVARLELGAKVLVHAAASESVIAIVDSSRKLSLLDTTRLDPISTKQLSGPASNMPFIVDGHVLVEVARKQLIGMSTKDLTQEFEVTLNSNAVVDVISTSSGILIAHQDGTLQFIDGSSGKLLSKKQVPAALDGKLIRSGDQVFAISVDGTLFPISITTTP